MSALKTSTKASEQPVHAQQDKVWRAIFHAQLAQVKSLVDHTNVNHSLDAIDLSLKISRKRDERKWAIDRSGAWARLGDTCPIVHYAVYLKHTVIVKYLLGCNPDPTLLNAKGDSLLQVAEKWGDFATKAIVVPYYKQWIEEERKRREADEKARRQAEEDRKRREAEEKARRQAEEERKRREAHKDKPMRSWSLDDVQYWMEGLAKVYSPLAEFLKAHDFDGNRLLKLNAQDVKEFQVSGVTSFFAREFIELRDAVSGAPAPDAVPSNDSAPTSSSGNNNNNNNSNNSPSLNLREHRAHDTALLEESFATPLRGVLDDEKNPLVVELDAALTRPEVKALKLGGFVMVANKKARHVLKKHAPAKQLGLTKAMIASIFLYTADSPLYVELNAILRAADRDLAVPFFPYLRALVEALRRLPAHTEQVWRGIVLDDAKLQKQTPATTAAELISDLTDMAEEKERLVWWAPTSCSTSMPTAVQFAGGQDCTSPRILFAISPLRGASIAHYSAIPSEAEVLLPPASMFLVKNVAKLNKTDTIVELQEVTPKSPLLQ